MTRAHGVATRGRGLVTRDNGNGVATRGRGLVLDRRRRESEQRRDLSSVVQAGAGARQLGMAGVDYDTIYLSIGKILFNRYLNSGYVFTTSLFQAWPPRCSS